MAWTVKPSGTMQIERREEPYLDDEIKAHLEQHIFPRYPTRQAATLPALHAIQEKHNWIPAQAMEELADFLELSPSVILDTASFYEEFFLEPKGKYLIQMCQSISCELLGNVALLDSIKQKLGIEAGQTTDDGKFTLVTVECLGSCGTAPCGQINGKLYEDANADDLIKTLDSLE